MNKNLISENQASYDKLPIKVPTANADWQALHLKHVQYLMGQYAQVFRKFSDIDAILIHSGKSTIKNSRDDQYWPTQPTPHFAHWSPYTETPAILVVKPSEKPTLYLERHTSYWEGPAPRNETWNRESFQIIEVDSLRDFKQPAKCVYIGDQSQYCPESAICGEHYDDILKMLDVFRTQKSEYEIASTVVATHIAANGHKLLQKIFMEGGPVSELDLHYEYLRATRQTEFSEPYGDIVGLGSNAAILHHVHYGRSEMSGDLSLLVDAGATTNGYASDITRTWVRGHSRGANLFRELVNQVEDVQQKLCKDFKVGTAYESLHNKSHELLADSIRTLGLSTESTEGLVASGATRCLFPHGLGHSLGLQVHDVGMKFVSSSKENPYLRNTSIIEAGQIVTVEPGIYFIETLLNRLKAMPVGGTFDWEKIEILKPFGGVRIEDNILATVDGPVNITRAFV